ncbi:MAG: hypothetical protein ACRC1W_16900 [Shewanella sp.]
MLTLHKPINTDIKIGIGHIVAVKDGWMLPGGKFTNNRAVAIRAAKGLHRFLVKR